MKDTIPKMQPKPFSRGFRQGFIGGAVLVQRNGCISARQIDVSIDAAWADVGEAFNVSFAKEGGRVGTLKVSGSKRNEARKSRGRVTEAA
jgi:hypothetical protein